MQQNPYFLRFKDCIKQNFKMNLLITSSPKTKSLINSFNLTPAEFLRPFGIISHEKKIKIRTINGREKLIPEFALNFIDFEEYQQISKQKIEECLKEVINYNAPDANSISNVNIYIYIK